MATDDELKVLPSSIAPDVVTSGAAPNAADKAVADAVTAPPSTPVVSDLGSKLKTAAAIKNAVDSGDPLAAATAATGKSSDLAKLREVQALVAPIAAPAIGGGPAPMPGVPLAAVPPPPVTPGAFDPIPPLVADVQPGAGPGGAPAVGSGAAAGPPLGAMPAPMPDATTGAGAPVAPPMPVPDAITGATLAAPGTGPSVANTPGLTFGLDGAGPGAGPLPPTDEYGQPLGPVAGMTDQQATQWAQNAPAADLLEQKRLLELRKGNTALKQQAEADAENIRQLRQNQEDYARSQAAAQAKLDRIVADSIKLASTKTDPNRYLSTRTASQRLRDILLAVGGGLLQARQGPGARNIGMDMVQREIDQDIDAQKQDIENGKFALGTRQNAVAEEFKRSGNLYEAAEKVRLATYQAAVHRMEAEQQNFDPRGTSYLNYAVSINDMKSKAAEHVEKIRKESFEEDIKQRNAKREEDLARSTIRHQQNEDAVAFGRLGLEKDKQKAENQVWTPQQLAAINPGQPVPPIAMSQKEYGGWLTTQKTGGEIAAQAKQETDRQADRVRQFSIGDVKPHIATDEKGKAVLGPDGLPQVTHAPLTNADGKPFLVADQGEHKSLSAKYLAASEVTDIINEIAAIRDRVGGESGLINSDEHQKLKVLQNRLTVLAKSGTEGMSSDEDMRKLTAAVGADDVTSFRSRAAGLEEAKSHVKTELNKTLRIAKYTGPEIDFPNPYAAPEAKASAEDIKDEDLLKKPSGGNDGGAFKRDFLAEYRRRTLGMSPDELRAFEARPITEDDVISARFSLPADTKVSGQHSVKDINEPDPGRVHTSLALSPQQREILNEVAARFDPDVSLAQQRRLAELRDAAAGAGPDAERARQLLERVAKSAHTQKLRAIASAALSDAASATIPETPAVPPPDQAAAYETLPPPRGP